MSIFSKIAAPFVSIWHTVEGAAVDVWHAVSTVWAFLVSAGRTLGEAWTWVVNGVQWFTGQVEGWAAEVFNGISHVLFSVIPNAIKWAITEATAWAGRAVRAVSGWAKGAVANVIHFFTGVWHKVEALARGLVSTVIKWVKGPVEWVIKEGTKIANLVLHPEALVKWILGSLIVPLILWLIRSSLPVLTWLFRSFMQREGEVATLLEDFIAKVL